MKEIEQNLEDIIPVCKLNTYFHKAIDGLKCDKGEYPINCRYELFFNDKAYCKHETIFNEDKAIDFAKWLEM